MKIEAKIIPKSKRRSEMTVKIDGKVGRTSVYACPKFIDAPLGGFRRAEVPVAKVGR